MAVTHEPPATDGDAFESGAADAPWRSWLAELDAPDRVSGDWLHHLEQELPTQMENLREEESRLAGVWQHMEPNLVHFLPAEIEQVVSARIDAAARRGAMNALMDMIHMERTRQAPDSSTEPAPAPFDETTMRRLLESIATDRAATGRAVIGEVLETLCSITLDLELTERRTGDAKGKVAHTLADLRNHVTAAADTLRALPNNVDIHPEMDEQLEASLRRCLTRYAGTLEAHLEWHGGEPENIDSASALVWVLQELLHHLHGAVAGWASVSVAVKPDITMTVTTPSGALDVGEWEPDWLLRSRLRLQLAGGEIRASATSSGSSVEIWLPE